MFTFLNDYAKYDILIFMLKSLLSTGYNISRYFSRHM